MSCYKNKNIMFCCVPCCKGSTIYKPLSLYRFPKPINLHQIGIFARWLNAVNCDKLYNLSTEQIYKDYRVCRLHFSDDSFSPSLKSLNYDAVPSLNLPEPCRQDIYDVIKHDHDYHSYEFILHDHNYYL